MKHTTAGETMGRGHAWRALRIAAFAGITACNAGPPGIAWGTDNCDFCHMTITDHRYAAAAITATGRTVRFDAVECLAGWTVAQREPPQSVWVTDVSHPGALIPVADARFHRTANGHSSQGRGFVAVIVAADSLAAGTPRASTATARPVARALPDPALTWEQVLDAVRRESAIPATVPGRRLP